MHFHILTLFPELFPGTLGAGVVGRALTNGVWSYDTINIRDFATNNYGSVDDTQFGGGAGQIMRADIIAAAIDSIPKNDRGRIIYFSPRGAVWNQKLAREMVRQSPDGVGGDSAPTTFTLLCGRYEGVDQRVIDWYNMAEISIGDYVISGGEIAAQVFIDSCVRLMDNVLHGGCESTDNESFEIGGLEWPLYTRPSSWRGQNVPEVLVSGHHGNIEKWRAEQSRIITEQRRPDLIKKDKIT